MKKMLLVSMSLLMLIGTLIAQSENGDQKTQQNAVVKNEHLVMKDGKMIHQVDGKEIVMQNQMTLHNGTIMHSNGSYQLKNGKQRQLNNGQCMDMNGRKYSSQGMLQKRMMGKLGMGGNSQNMHNNRNNGKMMGTSGSHH